MLVGVPVMTGAWVELGVAIIVGFVGLGRCGTTGVADGLI